MLLVCAGKLALCLLGGKKEGAGGNKKRAPASKCRGRQSGAAGVTTGLEEEKNIPNIPLQEKFHVFVLRGLGNIS